MTEAAEDWRQDPAAQYHAGVLAGLGLGLVPFAGFGEQMLDAADVLPQTSYFRRGVALGQIFSGVVLTVAGAAGGVGGGILSATGLGALLGVPAVAVSAGLVAGGMANIGAGFGALLSTGSGSGRSGGPAKSGGAAQPDRVQNPSKADSPIWKEAQPYRNGLRRSGREIWDWDATHNDIEVYDTRGRHLGSRDPMTGEMYKPAVPGRYIDL